MERSKKILFGVIAFVVFTFIIVLCLYSYNNLDIANANYKNLTDTSSLAFPYTSFNTNLIDDTFIGSSVPFSASQEITTYTFANSNNWLNTNVNRAYYNIKSYTYNGYSYNGLNIITSYENDPARRVILNFNNLSLSANNTYTFSILFTDLVNGISNLNNRYFRIDFNGSSGTYDSDIVLVSDVYTNRLNNNSLIYYYTITPNVNLNQIVFFLYYGCTLNFYLTKGDFPIYYNSSANYNIGSIDMVSNASITNNTFDVLFTNDNRLAPQVSGGSINSIVFSNSSLLNYQYILRSLQLSSSSIVPTIVLKTNTLTFGVPLVFNEYNTTTNQLYGNYISWVGSQIIGNTTINITLNVFQKGTYWELIIKNANSIYFPIINVSLFQNINAKLFSESEYQLGYSNALIDLENYYSSELNNYYQNGYVAGLSTASNGSFLGLLTASIESPLNAVLNMFDFDILGYNMKAFYLGLFTVAMILFIIKLFLGNVGGKKGD